MAQTASHFFQGQAQYNLAAALEAADQTEADYWYAKARPEGYAACCQLPSAACVSGRTSWLQALGLWKLVALRASLGDALTGIFIMFAGLGEKQFTI